MRFMIVMVTTKALLPPLGLPHVTTLAPIDSAPPAAFVVAYVPATLSRMPKTLLMGWFRHNHWNRSMELSKNFGYPILAQTRGALVSIEGIESNPNSLR